MSDFLVAYFYTQTEAVMSAMKLMAYGVQRSHLKMHVENRATFECRPAATYSKGDSPVALEAAAMPNMDSSTENVSLRVMLTNSVMMDNVCSMLRDTGAHHIDVVEHHVEQECSAI
ncbi:hypothetical protein [Dyella acidiphila]|uniref:Uncharacterized protein n=1 Tax=Dyella acidiphila TaxID=2775866 RepID=A0ABR9GBW4_9GAMM|nr:hypothetical protein [Dyella acidiphila]MBE1161521.1 hypothetical protein [Dyella acidiphila]